MIDKRKHKRYNVTVMNITGRAELGSIVQIQDINETSVKLTTDARLNIGKSYGLRFEFNADPFLLNGLVESSSISGSQAGDDEDVIPMYTAMIEFQNLLPDVKSKLMSFIHAYQHDEQMKLKNLRLTVNSPEKVMMLNESFRLKKISLGGALIESPTMLETEKIYSMQLTLREHTPLAFWGRIVSSFALQGESGELYEMGIQFIDMAESDIDRLKEFIRLLDAAKETNSCLWKNTKHI